MVLVADTDDGSNGGEVELEQMYVEIDLTDQYINTSWCNIITSWNFE